MRTVIIFILPLLLAAARLSGQACTTLGQTPQTAFPVCGTKALKQSVVPACSGRNIPNPHCNDANDYADVNPFWYKFTCYTSGTLGFTIKPNDISDDYDWVLFDVTNRNISLVYSNAALQVGSGWSGDGGLTGASSAGSQLHICGGLGRPLWSKMPDLVAGHQYLLMISHFTASSQSGYELSFGGGTANITDPLPGAFTRARFSCLTNQVGVKLNKRFQCGTLSANGSEFEILGGGAVVTGVVAAECAGGFDMDSVVLQLDRALPAGTHRVRIKNGGDGNTLLDACDNPIAVGQEIQFTVAVPVPVPFNRLGNVGCRPNKLWVLLPEKVRCNSVAANGSDFVLSAVSGPAVNVVAAAARCAGQITDTIELTLSNTVYLEGTYEVRLVRGSDGNSLISECGLETPLGYMVPFATKDTVNAVFNHREVLDCVYDTIFLQHNGAHGANNWRWSFEDGSTLSGQRVEKVYTVFGEKTVRLDVSNGVCVDSSTEKIFLRNTLKAEFEVNTPILCPLDMARFTNQSIGNIVSHRWDFSYGPGQRQVTPQPFRYPMTDRDRVYQVRLIVEDDLLCQDTVVHTLKSVASCRVAVPTAFTPNNDGVNDYLYPLNGYKTSNLVFRVYGRNGQMVFESRDWMHRWDGRINGSPAGVGTYAWVLEYTDTEFDRRVFQKGIATLLR